MLACLAVWPAFHDPVTWTPDALYYQARLLELRGASSDEALERTFEGPLSAELRARDPHHTGNARWVDVQRAVLRAARSPCRSPAPSLYPHAGDRSLLYVSLAGYVASIVALFGLLLLRFRHRGRGRGRGRRRSFLPPLSRHSSYPLTDSWGLTLEIARSRRRSSHSTEACAGFRSGSAAIALLGITRDSTWIPIARRRLVRVPLPLACRPVTLFATGRRGSAPGARCSSRAGPRTSSRCW